ncbi:MAG: DNA-3-methyladenine glycosylase 2 family protein [Pseudomonadota bacterium]|nr:DNA-3-methyladenine glycosylase 2 family protein [Pseudomonadota bacterium]
MPNSVFYLEPIPPFRLNFTAWALRRRPDNIIDRWDGAAYRRVMTVAGKCVEIAVTQEGAADSPRLRVTANDTLDARATQLITAALERSLGLRVDLTPFYHLASRDPQLNSIAQRFYGMKPPRFSSVFEGLINAIACQQLSLTLGIELLNRLAKTYGRTTVGDTGESHAFPQPEDLVKTTPGRLRELGFSHKKGEAIIALAKDIEDGDDLEALTTASDEEASVRLCNLPGIGRWSAEYVLLRGLGRIHIFPGDDVGARNNLQQWMTIKNPLDYESIRTTLARWKPYGGLIYFHLLLLRLAEKGLLNENKKGLSANMDIIEEADRESFPASDAPSWTHMSSGIPDHE